MTKNYCIKEGYQCNLNKHGQSVSFYSDNKKDSSSYQVAVYQFAAGLIKSNKLNSVLDIGCGIGLKLKKYVYPFCKDITGIDVEQHINFCKKHYNFGYWLIEDIELPKMQLDKKFDIIIASDVIEHLRDPNKLFSYIRRHAANDTYVIISTPERDLVQGEYSFGPPSNKAHIREWNMAEFSEYIKKMNFEIINHFLVQDKKLSFLKQVKRFFRISKTCQVVLCSVR